MPPPFLASMINPFSARVWKPSAKRVILFSFTDNCSPRGRAESEEESPIIREDTDTNIGLGAECLPNLLGTSCYSALRRIRPAVILLFKERQSRTTTTTHPGPWWRRGGEEHMLVYFLRYGKNELLGHKVLAGGEGEVGGE